MITLREAHKKIEKEVTRLSVSNVPTLRTLGCILAEDIVAPINVPGFVSSAMDGIAFRISDLRGEGPWRMPIQAIISAGDFLQKPLLQGHVVKIMTGAPLLDGADTVIPVEEIQFDSGYVIIKNRPKEGDYVRFSDDDIKKGQKLLDKGTILNPVDIGILTASGISDIKVTPKPNIAIMSTGSEIVELGEKLKPGQIYNSNDAILRALLAYDGNKISNKKRTIYDEPESLSKALQESLAEHDLVITTGGVSMGDYDFIPGEIKKLGGKIIFHKVKIKPGKPVLLAKIGRRWFLGLPGNPVSVVVGYHLFVRRVISRMMGITYRPRSLTAVLGSNLIVTDDRYYIVGAMLEEKKEGIRAYPAIRQMSNRLSSIKGINGFAFVEGGARTISKNTEVYVEWLF